MDLDLAIPKEARVINGFNVGVLKVTISMGNSHRENHLAIRRLESLDIRTCCYNEFYGEGRL